MADQSCTQESPREDLRDLPPSAKLVFIALKYQGEMTQKALADETLLPPRTVQYATQQLSDAGIVTEHVDPLDARQRIYSVKPEFKKDGTGED